jgi:hypothetical protein
MFCRAGSTSDSRKPPQWGRIPRLDLWRVADWTLGSLLEFIGECKAITSEHVSNPLNNRITLPDQASSFIFSQTL